MSPAIKIKPHNNRFATYVPIGISLLIKDGLHVLETVQLVSFTITYMEHCHIRTTFFSSPTLNIFVVKRKFSSGASDSWLLGAKHSSCIAKFCLCSSTPHRYVCSHHQNSISLYKMDIVQWTVMYKEPYKVGKGVSDLLIFFVLFV